MNTTSLQTATDLETLRYRPKEQGGRPTLMTAEVVEAIVRMIRLEGCSDSAAGLLEGISTSTLSRWKQEDDHFAMLLGQARAQFDVARLRNIGNALNRDGSMNWRAQAWLLQHSSPETYGSPSRRRQAAAEAAKAEEQSSAESGLPAPFQVTPEKLAELQARRARAMVKMQEMDAENARARTQAQPHAQAQPQAQAQAQPQAQAQAQAQPQAGAGGQQAAAHSGAEGRSTVIQGVFGSGAAPEPLPSENFRPHAGIAGEQTSTTTRPQHP